MSNGFSFNFRRTINLGGGIQINVGKNGITSHRVRVAPGVTLTFLKNGDTVRTIRDKDSGITQRTLIKAGEQ